MQNNIADLIKSYAADFDHALTEFFVGLKGIRDPLHKSMQYSLFAPGKRIRPVLLRIAAEGAGAYNQDAQRFAFALECVHAYSLVHDDLPCMDDDDYRRGVPTNHKVFGEGMAVLAGDALLNLAYEIVAEVVNDSQYPSRAAAALSELSRAAGARGMVGGQALDIIGADSEDLVYIHSRKTADLFTAALVCGALLGGGGEDYVERMREYGHNLGLLFQVTDDLLDINGNAAKMGKATGKDGDKITFPLVFGERNALRLANEYCEQAIQALDGLPSASVLSDFCRFVLTRDR